MFKVYVNKECGCFKKSDFTNNMTFESKDDALLQATEMAKDMNETFCQKHEFRVLEGNDEFMIFVDERNKPSHSGGCCGGGHCS